MRREWRANDSVSLTFPVIPRRTWSRPEVAASSGRVAVERGPFVYCLEGVDNRGDVAQLSLPPTVTFEESWDDDLAAVRVTARGKRHTSQRDDLYSDWWDTTEDVELVAVPYFRWGNRGQSTMEVWIRER